MTNEVRVPPIVSVEAAVKVYWSYPEMGNAEMRMLFGNRSPSKFALLKKKAFTFMKEQDMFSTSSVRVNTDAAFQAWGLDIDDLMKRYAKLQKIGVISKEETTA